MFLPVSVGILLVLALFQAPAPPQPVSPGTFAGTWVGLQTVANNTSPGVQEGQTVTMTIEIVDGRLVGTLTPFFGGNDGASFVDVHIVGEELRASAMVGKPPAVEPGRKGSGTPLEDRHENPVHAESRPHPDEGHRRRRS